MLESGLAGSDGNGLRDDSDLEENAAAALAGEQSGRFGLRPRRVDQKAI